MLIFLLVFFTVYGAMNAYLFSWVQRAFHLQGLRLWGFLAFLLLMVTGFVLVRALEHGATAPLATILAYLTYTWMAVVLWVLALGLAVDAWNLVVWAVSRLHTGAIYLFLPPRQAFSAVIFLVALASIWGVVEAGHQTVERLEVRTPYLPADASPITIAQISDVHFGLIEGVKRWDRITTILAEEKPDMLVATGDLVDGMAPHLNHLAGRIASLDFPLGKYAVTGNHEFYAGIDGSVQFLRSSGFTVLRQQSAEVGAHLLVAGVDDPAGGYRGGNSRLDENAVLPERDRKRFVLLLKHQPVALERSLGRFDLQLSGHTHKGQIYPFYYLVKMRYPMIAGIYEAGAGSKVYVNRGTGTWGPPLRLLAPPEVTIIKLIPKL